VARDGDRERAAPEGGRGRAVSAVGDDRIEILIAYLRKLERERHTGRVEITLNSVSVGKYRRKQTSRRKL
jgi:hypothetical protein